MLEYQKQIITEVVEEDGLLILSPGLGLFNILCSVLQLYTTGNHLVLILNTTDEQDDLIQAHMVDKGVHSNRLLQRIVYNTPAEQRSSLYRQSGVFSITSRILVVDMLLKRMPTSLISGIIVYNAHRVKPNSIEELILRIYRHENEEGFIKAFSDRPDAFVTGFAPLQNTLKSLFLRKVHLWPRFQVLVTDNLSQIDNNVIELQQPMTKSMDIIQQSLVECMEDTLTELRRSNPSVDVSEFTIENSFARSFDTIVRGQLDPIWHKVTPASKQLVADLKILRQLLSCLTTYDCVSFYSFVETIIAANSPSGGKQTKQSQWLFLEAGNRAIVESRKRVYLKPSDKEYESFESHLSINSHPPSKIKLVLEEQPKWDLLNQILKEIDHDCVKMNDGEGAPVLIMVSDKRTCAQVKEYISYYAGNNRQSEPFLNKLVQNFFRWRANITSLQGVVNGASTTQNTSTSSPLARSGRPPPNKRRRVRGGSSTAAASDRPSLLAESFRSEMETTLSSLDTNDEEEFTGIGPLTDEHEIEMGKDDILPTFEEIPANSLMTIQCYEDDMNDQILEDYKPSFIVMFDPNPAFIRQVEVYRASNPQIQLRVYFMLYENSVEEQNYLNTIRKEKESFEKLIHEKSIMAIPLPTKRKEKEITILRSNTRLAGGQAEVSQGSSDVIVDMREFRSSLPSILYAEGMNIIPCTLQVGDYILSPDMCVERKSMVDLIQSFSSGRLYTQCESMSAYYKIPILLIEFDQNRSFSLQNESDIRENIRANDLSSKLVLLTLAFPKLRIIWSSSPHETALVFEELKKTDKEPNMEIAVSIGADNMEDGEIIYNMTPQDILRSMPGVTSVNYRIIMNEVNNLAELVRLSESQLKKMIGEEASRKLYHFIHKKQGTLN
ncbi:hypothetical protein BDB01DRAFT_756085 [Pilobolus umbonatus]|nr:hypothetical protein BDB01DRAFT_756085 [Pilobolus umbonatus]